MGKKAALPFHEFCEVEWEDATSEDGWADKDTDLSPELMITRGWLVKSEERYITLANTIYKNSADHFGGTQTIPRGMIINCRKIKVSNAVKHKSRHQLHPEPSAEEIHREPRKG